MTENQDTPLYDPERQLWESLIDGLEDTPVTHEPTQLLVDGILDSPADLYSAILENAKKLDSERSQMALDFFGDVVQSSDSRSIMAELPYEERDGKMFVKLVYPGVLDNRL